MGAGNSNLESEKRATFPNSKFKKNRKGDAS
jgi:hypothetical protein